MNAGDFVKKSLFLIIVCSAANIVLGQNLYTQTYGDHNNTPIVFLHGGPGYNSAGFEATTANTLSEKGFFVVVYDRRGEGRSPDSTVQYSFDESVNDLHNIIDSLNLDSVALIGHSFGGMLATKFTSKYPQITSSIVLVSAPISLQKSFKTIIEKSQEVYQAKSDSVNLKYLNMLRKMDTTSLMYSSYCFMHARQNGFYSPNNLSTEADSIYDSFKNNEELYKYASKMGRKAPQGFWENDQYTTMNLSEELRELKNSGEKIYGLYGREDGLYSADQINHLKEIIGKNNLMYLKNCSHNVFIDRQKRFIRFLKKSLK